MMRSIHAQYLTLPVASHSLFCFLFFSLSLPLFLSLSPFFHLSITLSPPLSVSLQSPSIPGWAHSALPPRGQHTNGQELERLPVLAWWVTSYTNAHNTSILRSKIHSILQYIGHIIWHNLTSFGIIWHHLASPDIIWHAGLQEMVRQFGGRYAKRKYGGFHFVSPLCPISPVSDFFFPFSSFSPLFSPITFPFSYASIPLCRTPLLLSALASSLTALPDISKDSTQQKKKRTVVTTRKVHLWVYV